MQLNAHEQAVLVVALIAFVRPRILSADGKPRLDGWVLVAVAVALSEGLSFLVGGLDVRMLALQGIQVLVEAVGGTAFLSAIAVKASGATADDLAAQAVAKKSVEGASVAASVTGSALLCFALVMGFGAFSAGASCTPPTQSQDATVLDAGCALIPIVDPNGGALIGSICESLVPVVTTILTDILKASKPANSVDAGALAFTSITHGSKSIGAVRADLAVATQAKLDALP